MRLYYFMGAAFLYVSMGFIRKKISDKQMAIIGLFLVDILLVFLMERLSRYVVNYALHTFYILIMIDLALSVSKKQFLGISMVTGGVSLIKYGEMLLLDTNYTRVAETVFFVLFTAFTIVALYLVISLKEQKQKTELIYQTLLSTYEALEEKYASGVLDFTQDETVTSLTERELEICHLVGKGSNNKEISETLYISEGTTKNHITNILKKLSLRDRTQLAIYALKNRL